MKKQKQFIIKDWAGNNLFNGETFKTFDDAWDHLYSLFPDEADEFFGEYIVEIEE